MWISSQGSAKGALRRILQTVEERYKRKFKSQERTSAQEGRAGNKIQTAHGKKNPFKVPFHSEITIKLSSLQTEVKDTPQVTIYNPLNRGHGGTCGIASHSLTNSFQVTICSEIKLNNLQDTHEKAPTTLCPDKRKQVAPPRVAEQQPNNRGDLVIFYLLQPLLASDVRQI